MIFLFLFLLSLHHLSINDFLQGKTIKLILDYLRIFLIDVVAAGLNISIHHKCRVIFAGWHDQVQCGLLAYLVDVVVVAPIISFHHNCYNSLAGWHDQVHRGLLAHRPEQERQEKSLRGDQQQTL